MNDRREDLARRLAAEMAVNTGFVRIHAAEALAQHDFGHLLPEAFHAEADTAPAPVRIGVWRVLSLIAEGDKERARFINRIRRVMLDPQAPDRLQAAESIAKVTRPEHADRPAIEQWLAAADDATAPFLLWLVMLFSNESFENDPQEARLGDLLNSSDPIARLRAAYVLGFLEDILPASLERLEKRISVEAANSPSRVYLVSAAFTHAPPATDLSRACKKELLAFLKTGKGNEQLEAAFVIGLRSAVRNSVEDVPALRAALESREADGRIGAASALLLIER